MKKYALFKDGSNKPVIQFRAADDDAACDHLHCMKLDRNAQYDLYRQTGTDPSRWPWVTTVVVVSNQTEPRNPKPMNTLPKWKKDGFAHYRSEDGRWMIERKEFDLPFKCVRWDLYDGHRKIDRCDTLSEAKELAAEESSYIHEHTNQTEP